MLNKKVKVSMVTALTLVTGLGVLTGCSSGGGNETGDKKAAGNDKKVQIELFSNKSESQKTLEALIEKFEIENPTIDVVLNAPPEAETVLRTRMTKNEMPDILAMGGNNTYGELAREGVFMDFSQEPLLEKIQPAYVEMLGRLVGEEGTAVYGIPYATNANGIIYNKEKFEKAGYTIPKTWDELIALAEDIKAKGETPFYYACKDAWTVQIPWNALGATLVDTDFPTKKSNGETTFKESYKEVGDKLLQLSKYGNADPLGTAYSDASTAFAKGESYMYIQGNWAISEVLKFNPEAQIGMFAFPASNDEVNLVSGVDVLLTGSKDTKNPEEVKAFIAFMLKEENASTYIQEQAAFSAVQGVVQESPTVSDLIPFFEEEKLISFPDHYYLPGFQFNSYLQQLFIDGDVDAMLDNIDREWDNLKSLSN